MKNCFGDESLSQEVYSDGSLIMYIQEGTNTSPRGVWHVVEEAALRVLEDVVDIG